MKSKIGVLTVEEKDRKRESSTELLRGLCYYFSTLRTMNMT